MNAGGAVQTTLQSGIPYPNTYRRQMAVEWFYFGFGYRARIYHYNQEGNSVGFAEVVLGPGQAAVTSTSATLTFTGMKYTLGEIIYNGLMPTSLPVGRYSLKAFTYGYLQVSWPNVFVQYHLARTLISLLVACETHATVILTRAGFFQRLTENTSYRIRINDFAGDLRGGQFGNATVGATTISFLCAGFGSIGHFFYVTPDGTRWYDYGIDVGNYTVVVERFGYLEKFDRTQVTVQFTTLNSQKGFVCNVYLLNKIYGTVHGISGGDVVRLSWARITLESYGEVVTSFDGAYWIFMPNGQTSGGEFRPCIGIEEHVSCKRICTIESQEEASSLNDPGKTQMLDGWLSGRIESEFLQYSETGIGDQK